MSERRINKSIIANYKAKLPVTLKILGMGENGVPVKQPEPEPVKTDDLKVAAMVDYYEKNSGRVLTPRDIDKLVDYADTYPDGWFEKAVDEAVKNNAKSPMSYIGKVMETWQQEAKSGTHRRGTRKGASRLKERDNYTPSGNEDL